MIPEIIQKKNSFDKISLIKILKGSAIAGGAAAGIYFIQSITGLDFGQYTEAVVALGSIVIGIIKAFKQGA